MILWGGFCDSICCVVQLDMLIWRHCYPIGGKAVSSEVKRPIWVIGVGILAILISLSEVYMGLVDIAYPAFAPSWELAQWYIDWHIAIGSVSVLISVFCIYAAIQFVRLKKSALMIFTRALPVLSLWFFIRIFIYWDLYHLMSIPFVVWYALLIIVCLVIAGLVSMSDEDRFKA